MGGFCLYKYLVCSSKRAIPKIYNVCLLLHDTFVNSPKILIKLTFLIKKKLVNFWGVWLKISNLTCMLHHNTSLLLLPFVLFMKKRRHFWKERRFDFVTLWDCLFFFFYFFTTPSNIELQAHVRGMHTFAFICFCSPLFRGGEVEALATANAQLLATERGQRPQRKKKQLPVGAQPRLCTVDIVPVGMRYLTLCLGGTAFTLTRTVGLTQQRK